MSFRAARSARTMAVLAIAAGAVVASAIPGNADVSTQSPSVGGIRVESPAKLQAGGAAIIVPVTAVCQPGSYAYVNVQVTQRVGNALATGSGSTRINNCTGTSEDVRIAVHAQVQGKAFRTGAAFASATLNGPFPGPFEDYREIKIAD
ncbi:hypothetical protein BN6_75320 [Saccharothrix espanaensis DSM 44229]|uniref:Secreted protein n=2 Tax=Saccharothrix espanaensis TaxID=103731 RepID=K0KB46_SACES|nr:hypothetical protein BN6_75320 [Saccharothrix espanaensis DSM 44229]